MNFYILQSQVLLLAQLIAEHKTVTANLAVYIWFSLFAIFLLRLELKIALILPLGTKI